MRPRIRFLAEETIGQIVAEAYALLSDPGVQVHSERALRLLAERGAVVDFEAQVAHIPADLILERGRVPGPRPGGGRER